MPILQPESDSLNDQRDQVLGQLLLLHDDNRTEAGTGTNPGTTASMLATLQERERLARELHDSIGQVLGYVSLQAQTIRKWVQAGNTEKAESLLSRLAEVAQGCPCRCPRIYPQS